MSAAAPVGEETRERILQVALELIAEQGFAATSTRELSERLGFTKAALYYHFRTKDELLAVLVGPVVDELAALVANAPLRSSAAARRELLVRYIDLVARHESLMRVLADDPSVRRQPLIAACRALFVRLTQLLSGEEDPDTTARARAHAALGGVHAAWLRAAPSDDRTVLRHATVVAACGALGVPAPRDLHA